MSSIVRIVNSIAQLHTTVCRCITDQRRLFSPVRLAARGTRFPMADATCRGSRVRFASASDSDGGRLIAAERSLLDESLLGENGHRRNGKGTKLLDKLLSKIYQGTLRNRRVALYQLEQAIQLAQRQGRLNSWQMSQLVRFTGRLLRECSPTARQRLTELVWSLADVQQLSIINYNELLQVYLDNEVTFEPEGFLQTLHNAGLVPDRGTLERLIRRYGELGDIANATKVKDLLDSGEASDASTPMSQRVLQAFAVGYIRSGDETAAMKFLDTATPSNDTYATLACALIDAGRTNRALDIVHNRSLAGHQLLRLVRALARNDDLESIRIVLEKLVPAQLSADPANSCLELLALGKLAAARLVFERCSVDSNGSSSSSIGGLFLQQMIRQGLSVDEITQFCDELTEKRLLDSATFVALGAAMRHGDREMILGLIEHLVRQAHQVREHFFYPVVCKAADEADVYATLSAMTLLKVDISREILIDFVLPRVSCDRPSEVLASLINAGCSVEIALNSLAMKLLDEGRANACLELVARHTSCRLNPSLSSQAGQIASAENLETCVDILTHVVERPSGWNPKQFDAFELIERFVRAVPSDLWEMTLPELERRGLPLPRQGHGCDSKVDCSEQVVSRRMRSNLAEMTLTELESHLIELENKGMNTRGVERKLLLAYCRSHAVEKAEAIAARLEGQPLSGAILASLMDLNTYKGDFDTAMKFFREVRGLKGFNVDEYKVINLAVLAIKQRRLDEAKQILKSQKFGRITGSLQRNAAWLAEATAQQYGVDEAMNVVREFATKFTKISISVLRPIMKTALDKVAIEDCVRVFYRAATEYGVAPMERELCMALIRADRSDDLATVIGISSKVQGESRSNVKLAAYLTECRRLVEAAEVLARCPLPRCDKHIEYNMMTFVENRQIDNFEAFASVLADVGYRKSALHDLLIRGYCRAGEIDKAILQRTRSEQENVLLSPETLQCLADTLKSSGHGMTFKSPSE